MLAAKRTHEELKYTLELNRYETLNISFSIRSTIRRIGIVKDAIQKLNKYQKDRKLCS